jgi:xanthine dehydrogenase large subunit
MAEDLAEFGADIQAVGRSVRHDSAEQHVAGAARYVDDIPEPKDLLHIAFGQSDKAHARIVSMDLDAVRSAPGVVAVFTVADIPGENNVGPVRHDDRLFADGLVEYAGQSLFAVAATSVEAARRAARLARVDYELLPIVTSIAEARDANLLIEDSQVMARGDADAAFNAAPRRLHGEVEIGGQDHFYLEGQVSLAIPGEGRRIHLHCSTQDPSGVQHRVAEVLGVSHAEVTVEVRRLGGAFGGKETQAALGAAAAALAARKTGRPAKCRMDRDDDMVMTGKRHDFLAHYNVGFDDDGRILALNLDLASRCGSTLDLSAAINDQAMLHADNGYFLPAVRIVSHRLKTHTVSNTALRGFGAPQGMLAIERVMDAVAGALGRDPLEVRKINLYGPGRDVTPYDMTVEDNIAPELIAELARRANYAGRREAVARFNAGSQAVKRGIALTPVKFGVAFATPHLNQAGALIQVYADGSVLLNHGGTEMGQGLMTKVAQVVAEVFAAPVETVKISATVTDKAPNTSATAASSDSDLNGMAAFNAAMVLRDRLADVAAAEGGGAPEAVMFAQDGVHARDMSFAFPQLCRMAQERRVSLSATGYAATPKIHYDRATHRGRPFLYFAYGAAVSEVAIDTATGEHRVLRVDILHDVGRSLNPAIDLGQIEGGFIQGMGWLTTEELVYDVKGRLLTHGPSTYKIPCAGDRPAVMTIDLWPGQNAEPTIHRSKAVGEAPLMLALSVFSALGEAVVAAAGPKALARLNAPATPERILVALGAIE